LAGLAAWRLGGLMAAWRLIGGFGGFGGFGGLLAVS